MSSSKNPFRVPAPSSPQRTASPAAPLPPSPISGPSSHPDMPPHLDIDEDDELPPPYTPAPNAAIGEETVGLGPQRPFQPPPPQPPPEPRPQPGWAPPAPGPSWQPPPPRHPSTSAPWQGQQQYRPRPAGGGGLFGALFDTVRDIADVVSGAHDERTIAAQRANVSAYAAPAPYGSTSTAYAPPPAPHAPHAPPGQSPESPPPPPPRAASTPPRSTPSAVPDDGTPTSTPVPGHPLLRDGKLLVYPREHLCVKCKNTGYKNYDPSHPCQKCWDKYGRPYTGALTYTPWASSRSDSRMQRPLPTFSPPQTAPPPQLQYGSPPSHLQHNRSVSQPHYVHPSGPGPSYYVVDPLSPYPPAPPVPNAIVVSPGDPRLGGRMCWRCGGAGIRTLLLIDVTSCDMCNGTGRVWV